jgi:hypothetical protein
LRRCRVARGDLTLSRVSDAIQWIAGYGLPDRALAPPSEPFDDETWSALLSSAYRQRVTGHLQSAIDEGALCTTDAQRRAATDQHELALVRDVTLERLLVTTLDQIDPGGAAVRVLRGPSVAHTAYRDPALRSFGDLDLLVAQRQYDWVVTMLCGRGARRRYAEPRPGFDARFGKGVCIETPTGLEIDLHRTFVAGPFGLAVDADALFDSNATFVLADRTFPTIDPESRFLDACFHAALRRTEPRLVPIRDVAQMTLLAQLDVDRVRDLCRRWRCGIVVQRAIEITWGTFELASTPEIVRWARAYEPSRFEQRALRSYGAGDDSYARQAVAGLRAVPGIRRKAAYAASLLLPTRDYVRTHEGSYLRRVRRGLRLLLSDLSKQRRDVSRA